MKDKTLNIKVTAGCTRLFVNDEEIGVTSNNFHLIDSVNLTSDENFESTVEIVFKNLLGGLFEADHKEILTSMGKAIHLLKGLPVKVSIRWQCGLEETDDEEKWLSQYTRKSVAAKIET